MFLPMLPSLVSVLGFWPVTTLELALATLVVVGLQSRWVTEAMRRSLACDGGFLRRLGR